MEGIKYIPEKATIDYVPEFEKEYSKFCKKHNGFEEDMKRFEKALKIEWPKLLTGTVPISHIGKDFRTCYKAREFRCKSLNRGCRSGIRIVFTFDQDKMNFLFIELVFKGTDDNHDRDRLMKYALKVNNNQAAATAGSSVLTE